MTTNGCQGLGGILEKIGEQLLTVEEVCQYLRITRATVDNWRQAGKLVALKTPGGHLRFRLSEIQRLLKEETLPA